MKMRINIHYGIQVWHSGKLRAIQRIAFSEWESRIHFSLESFVRFWMRQEVIEDATENRRCRVCACNDSRINLVRRSLVGHIDIFKSILVRLRRRDYK